MCVCRVTALFVHLCEICKSATNVFRMVNRENIIGGRLFYAAFLKKFIYNFK